MNEWIALQGWAVLIIIFIISLWLLTKATDLLVDNAVVVSKDFGISELVIGATIVSIGTSLPELSSSVVSVIQGSSGFALGNAIGSVITNSSLVLGVGALAGSIPVLKVVSKRLLFLSGIIVLLVVSSIQSVGGNFFRTDGAISQYVGFLLLLLLVFYLFISFKNASSVKVGAASATPATKLGANKLMIQVLIILLSAVVVAFSATLLVAVAETAAGRIGVSEAVISGTIVALGTSLPELSTTYASARKGFGGLAMGNIIGASIMNILLVLGVSVSLQIGGIAVPAIFYSVQFPLMLLIVGILLGFVYNTKKHEINKKEGLGLILIYLIYLVLNVI